MSDKDYLEIEPGAKIRFLAIPPLSPQIVQENYEKKHPEPKPPTYLVESVPGVKVEHEHTKDTVVTEKEKEDFLNFEQAHNEWNNNLSQLLLKLFIGEGTKLEVSDEVRVRWEKKATLYGIDIPEDEDEYRITMLSFQGIKDANLLLKISQGVMRKTGVPEEELVAANKLF